MRLCGGLDESGCHYPRRGGLVFLSRLISLKIGLSVAIIQFFDQNLLVLTHNKWIVWTKTIMAYFDRWLKGQREWRGDLFSNR